MFSTGFCGIGYNLIMLACGAVSLKGMPVLHSAEVLLQEYDLCCYITQGTVMSLFSLCNVVPLPL